MAALCVVPTKLLLSYLNDKDIDIQLCSLLKLIKIASTDWLTLNSQIDTLESYYKNLDTKSDLFKLTSLLLSQLYFHLDIPMDCLKCALNAGDELLNFLQYFYPLNYVNSSNNCLSKDYISEYAIDYVNNVITLLIDQYIITDGTVTEISKIVDLIVLYYQPSDTVNHLLLGLALDSCNINYLSIILKKDNKLIRYILQGYNRLFETKAFKIQAFHLMKEVCLENINLDLYEKNVESRELMSDFFKILIFLQDSEQAVAILEKLIQLDLGLAYQILIDIQATASKSFIDGIINKLKVTKAKNLDSEQKMTDDGDTSDSKNFMINLLNGCFQTKLLLKFCNNQNETDIGIFDVLKEAIGNKYAVLQNMLILAHGFAQRGTTSDGFLRSNFNWFSKTANWNKFTAIASLGVIHQTHAEKSMKVLSTYLPNMSGWKAENMYADGGGLLALGLVHFNMQLPEVIDYLKEQLTQTNAQEETQPCDAKQYGAALGLGFASMGGSDAEIGNLLETILVMDYATSGEAAALALGLVFLGTNNMTVVDSLLNYANESQHEKLVRACAVAVSLVCCQGQELIASVVTKMLSNSNQLIRYGGCFTLGVSYAGTANKNVIQQLLKIIITDPSDEVRQAAVFGLSIVFMGTGELDHAAKIFRFLADSFNFRVRYAAILGLGIFAAGTGSREVIETLMAGINDSHELVRQATFIALALVLMSCYDKQIINSRSPEEKNLTISNVVTNSKPINIYLTPSELREQLIQIALSQIEDKMTRVGAILGIGILDAGGRTVTLSTQLTRRNLNVKDRAGDSSILLNHDSIPMLRNETIAGFVLFTQMWYWHPLILGLSIAMRPCGLVGITVDGKVPKSFEVSIPCKPSDFAPFPKYVYHSKLVNIRLNLSFLSAAQRAGLANPKIEKEKQKMSRQMKKLEVEQDQNEQFSQEDEENQMLISNGCKLTDYQYLLKPKITENSKYKPVIQNFAQSRLLILESEDANEDDAFVFS